MRRLRVDDFDFVRELAAKQSNFTIPPPYVLWLLTRVRGDICLVAEEEGAGPVAYLLAVPVEKPQNAFYVWQLAARPNARSHVSVLPLLKKLFEITESQEISSMFFSAIPNSAAFRRIRRYARTVWSATPKVTSTLSGIVAPGEVEYRIDLR